MRAPASCLAGVLLLALAVLGGAACGPTVDLAKSLEVTDVASGWHDAGVVDGKNKLVPAIAFKLKNNSDQTLSSLQVNALFRRVNEPDEWGSGYVKVTGSEGLPAGQSTPPLVINSQLGYTGVEARADLLKHRAFVDAKVEIFAKYGSTQWAKLGEFPITRQLEIH
ncbi:MAG: hypothetical protein AB7O32_20475 [Vicinamibacterales bacterium]